MDDNLELRVVKVPVMDTGIGREAGYRDDAELIAAAEAERAALPPAERDLLDAAHQALERRVLFGD